MKRLMLLWLAVLVVLAPGSQSQVASASQAGSLPLEERILRVASDNRWQFIESEDGPWVEEYAQMIDGEPQEDLWPATQTFYDEHEVQDVHVYFATVLPVDTNYESIGTSIETRILRFTDDNRASSYLANIFDSLVAEDETDDTVDWDLRLIHPMPTFHEPVVGWTLQEPFYNAEGEVTGHASSVRYMAQIDNMLISVAVMGPLVDFNFDVAFLMLGQQAACAVQEDPCAAATISDLSSSWQFVAFRLFWVDDSNEADLARWMFPVEEPIRFPLESVTLTVGPDSDGTEQTATTTDSHVTRTPRTGSSGDSEVTRTPRTSSSGDQEITRTTRTSSASDNSVDPTNATVLLQGGTIFSRPDDSTDIIEVVIEGDRVTVTGDVVEIQSERWYPVIASNGTEGWIIDTEIGHDD